MRTGIHWDKFHGKTQDEQIKMLASAAGFEMSKPDMCRDMSKTVAALAGRDVRINKELSGAVRDAMSVERVKGYLASKYATSSDTPQLVDPANQLAEYFHTNMPELDLAWMLLFDEVDLRTSVHDHFDILDTNAGVTWAERKSGESTKILRTISEAITTVKLTEYSAGLGILDRWLERQMFWNIDEALAEFRSKYYDLLASSHYGLLTALGAGVNQAFDTDDVKTANKAMGTILRAVKSKGYAAGQAARFYAVCEVEQVGRLEKMLTAQRGSAIVDKGTVSQPLVVGIEAIIGTTQIAAGSTGWYLVLPGRKMKTGRFKDLKVEGARNAYVSAEDLVGVAQFNAAIGDSDQVRRCLFA